MNIREIKQLIRLISEDNKDITKLSTGGSKGKNGKGADSIAVGAATPYKQDNKNVSEEELAFPAVAELVKKMKEDSFQGNKMVTGTALAQVKKMIMLLPMRKDENGQYILPFSNNVRLKEIGGLVYIGPKEDAPIEPATAMD